MVFGQYKRRATSVGPAHYMLSVAMQSGYKAVIDMTSGGHGRWSWLVDLVVLSISRNRTLCGAHTFAGPAISTASLLGIPRRSLRALCFFTGGSTMSPYLLSGDCIAT